MAKERKEKKKVKRPTAQKRMIQNSKSREANRIFKAQVRTAIRCFRESLVGEDSIAHRKRLNTVYSLLDKCVKKGVFKLNKASRIKSRLAAQMASQQ